MRDRVANALPPPIVARAFADARELSVAQLERRDDEVRMLELGREAGEYVEVLGGIEPGTRYVAASSYVIKADIEKSGASHDH